MKIWFPLERDDEDWPPVATESLWARAVADDEFEIDNIPWFVRGRALGDRVRAERDDDGVLTFQAKVAWSGHYTIRVIPLGDAPSHEALQDVVDTLLPLGAECDSALPAFRLLAVDIPPTARVRDIKRLLVQREVDGRWGFDEGCVDDRWQGL